jgi:hypothetical protein
MCTTGAIILGEDEYLLFKNKDFSRAKFSDRVVTNREFFGPRGLETFDRTQPGSDRYSGLSCGANKYGLLVGVTHVKKTGAENANYDVLAEMLMSEARDVPTAKQLLEEYLAHQACWWGNLILTDGKTVAAVEIRDQEMRIDENASRIVRTNHQIQFGDEESPDGIACSANRFFSADLRLSIIESLDEIFDMLSAHDNGAYGICNHQKKMNTVYSYVMHRNPDRIRIYVCQGNPCKSKRATMRIPLGKSWSPDAAKKFIDRFPGATAAD